MVMMSSFYIITPADERMFFMPRLGSDRHPACVRVRSPLQAEAIVTLCNLHGWKVIVGIEPNQPEEVTDLRRLIEKHSQRTAPASPSVGRNAPCPCGSGKKYKACCLER